MLAEGAAVQSPRRVATFCRICEAHCGLTVEVGPGDTIGRIRPDRDHPVTRGYGCVKGMGLGDLNGDPERVNHPLKRVGQGFERVSWEEALRDIGARIRSSVKHHGARSVGMYRGNPSYFSFQHVLFASDFMRALGSPNLFTSVSIDSNNKFLVATEMYGHPLVQTLPDVSRTSFLLCLGSNPVVSQMSIIQLAHPLRRLQEIVDRGGRVVTVDPRRTETAARVGEHLFIRPGTDAALLLALLHVVSKYPIPEVTGFEAVTGLEEALQVAEQWSPERAAAVTGVPASEIVALAEGYRQAESAAIYHSTGVNMGGFGSLCTWVTQVLALVTGNLDQLGGQVLVRPPIDLVGLSPGQRQHQDAAGAGAVQGPRLRRLAQPAGDALGRRG